MTDIGVQRVVHSLSVPSVSITTLTEETLCGNAPTTTQSESSGRSVTAVTLIKLFCFF